MEILDSSNSHEKSATGKFLRFDLGVEDVSQLNFLVGQFELLLAKMGRPLRRQRNI